jgi:hypothetical protein
LTCEVEHPAREDVGEFDEIARHGVTILLHDVDALPDLDPVAGETAEGLVHGGEKGDGAGARGFAGLDHKLCEEFGLFIGGHEGARADFDVEDQGVEALGEFLAHDAGGDEEWRFDGARVVSECIQDAVSGDDRRGLADEGRATSFENVAHLGKRELGIEAGDGFEFVQRAAGVAEAPPADHGDDDSWNCFRGGMSEPGGREDRGDEQGCFVADSAGGVLVDGESVERFGVGDLSGEAHGFGERGQLSRIEAAEKDGHQKGADLGVSDELSFGGAVDDGMNEGADLCVGEGEAVAFVEDDVDGMDSKSHGFEEMSLGVVEEEGGGEQVGDAGLRNGPCFAGEEDDGVRCAEFVDGLAAGSAGLAGGVVEVRDRDGADTDFGAVEADSGGDGGLFGADGEAVGGVFDIAAGDNSTVGQQDGRAYAEVAVGGVGVIGDGDGALLQVRGLGRTERGELAGWAMVRRHDVSEAIGCRRR